ncbi:tonB dependent receptor family protein [Asticcacaulis biprosthecium C19]|uniref:TonB dependent receptor family protein n=1 Tax=Asticcacaulis biprosthecium C19 TaxID=715226 RepID=F4QIT3_9CAUL|nr:TonB-dependent receptor [Asticcacaulis biprosthecium]EGF91842.1 tonB dependent receptor family protein [Asticcacaulis biprosthecium C19]
MKGLLLRTACAAALAASVAIASPALSQDAPADDAAAANDDNAVVITSTRRAVKAQDVPISVTSFSQKDLTAKGIVGFEGLGRETPGVVLNRPSANFNYFTARGVATNSGYGAGLQSAVAIYIDEQPINANGNTTNIDPNLFDVERVEFLRGPQGTLFGSGSLAGALRIITKAPNLSEFEASVLGDVAVRGNGSWRQRYNAMVNVPLVDGKLALRAVLFHRDEDGYITNIGTGTEKANSLIDTGGRVSLMWKPTERLSIRATASHENSNPQDSGMTSPNLGKYVKISDKPDLFTGKFTSYNVTVDYQFDGAKFMSSSNYSNFDQKFVVDLAGTFGGAIPFGLDAYGYRRTVVQEARLVSDPGGKFDWVLGGFYLERRQYLEYFLRSRQDFLTTYNIRNTEGEYYLMDYSHADSKETAIYGDLTYRFSDKLWVSGGLRYGSLSAQGFTDAGGFSAPNYYTYAFYGAAGYVFPGNTGYLNRVATPTATGREAKGEKPSYRLSLSYKPHDNLTTYAAVSTGFRTPVINALAGRVSLTDPNDLIIPDGADSDDLTNYELGAKGRWFGGKLGGSLALYRIDWRNIQVQANRVSDGVQFATNIGGATSQGLEWELHAYPRRGLVIGLNGSVNKSEVDKLTAQEAAYSGAVLGTPLSSPKFQGTAYVNYAWDLTPKARANWSLAISHVGEFPNTFPNTPGKPTVPMPTFDYTDAYTLVNTTLAIAMDNYTVGFYVENLTNSDSVVYVHPETFFTSRYARLTPRTVGVRLVADF